MSNELDTEILEESGADASHSLIKGALGTIPIIGPMVSELYGSIIPRQRLDRLIEFVKLLSDKFDETRVNMDEIKKQLENNYIASDFFDEVCIQASKSRSEERKEYLSNILINGLTEEQMIESHFMILLEILGQLNDIEILILYSYTLKARRDSEFQEKYGALLMGPVVHLSAPQEVVDSGAIHKTYKNKLARLDLLEYNDRGSLSITTLGKLILKQIGLLEDSEH